MQRDARVWLADAAAAAEAVVTFCADRTLSSYRADLMLRSAVERQLEILGESLGQLAKANPELGARIPELRRIVGFRNFLAHAYGAVEDDVVWAIVQSDVPALRSVLEVLLLELDAGDPGRS